MPRTFRYWLPAAAMVTALMLAGWPGIATDPATLISRVSAIALSGIVVVLPSLVRRKFGPLGRGWRPAVVRAGGCSAVVALLAVKSRVEHIEFAAATGRPSMAGLWLGEAIFLIVIAGYLAGLLAVTATRAPASRTTLVIGGGAGAAIGLAVYGLRPLADRFHADNAALAVLHEVSKVLAVPLVIAAVVAAALAAARRATSRKGGPALREVRARQGLAAGACVGFVAAVVVSLLGIATIALLRHSAIGLQWTLPGQSGSVYDFEAAISDAGAGFLLVLIIFPVVGAGLGAWAGLFAGDSGLRPDGGGGGGGGPRSPGPEPMPPGGGRRASAPPELARADLARLLTQTDWRVIAPERVPVGAPSDARSGGTR